VFKGLIFNPGAEGGRLRPEYNSPLIDNTVTQAKTQWYQRNTLFKAIKFVKDSIECTMSASINFAFFFG
jgi:hypothetical protein